MGFPVGPYTPVLMIAETLPDGGLYQASWAGRLPDITTVGQVFWASSRDAPGLAAAGYASYAPEGTLAPPVEPPWTAHGSAGFGAGTSNCSHLARPHHGGKQGRRAVGAR